MKLQLIGSLLALIACSCGSSSTEASGAAAAGAFYSCDSSDSSKVEGATSPFGPDGLHVCTEVTFSTAGNLSQSQQECDSNKGTGKGFSATAHCTEPAVGCFCSYETSGITSATYEYNPNAGLNAQTEKEQCAQLPSSSFKCFGVPGF